MPKMDGLTATKEIRKLEAEELTSLGRPCVIVAMTANAVGGFKVKEKPLLETKMTSNGKNKNEREHKQERRKERETIREK